MALTLKDLVKGLNNRLAVAEAIEKKKYTVTSQDVIDLAAGNGNPSLSLLRMKLKYGNAEQRKETVSFLVGAIVETETYDRQTVDDYAEILLEYFHDQSQGLEKV